MKSPLTCLSLLCAGTLLIPEAQPAERPPITLPPLRQDATGLIVIEAENFDANVPQGIHRWDFVQTPAGYSGDGTMYALPDEPVAVINYPDSLTSSPRLDYKVQFVKTGTHYLWFRGSDGGGDSLNAGIDGDSPDPNLNNMDSPDCCGARAPGGVTYTWISGTGTTFAERAVFEVAEAGLHTVNIWMREDGQIVDKIVVTTDPNFTPSGSGPAESDRVGDPFPPAISITTPTAGEEIAAGSAVNIAVEASDQDGTIAKVEFFVGGSKIGEDTTTPFGFQHQPAQAGPMTISAKATDNSGLETSAGPIQIFIARAANALNPLRQDGTGLVVIEAENFDANAAQGQHRWIFDRTPGGFSGAGTMYALPDTGAAVEWPDAQTSSPRLDFKVEFGKTGTHYFWFRGSDGGGNSLHGGINGDSLDFTMNNIDQGCCGTRGAGGVSYTWVGGIGPTPDERSRFEVPATGVHTINVWMREDGQIVDKILITTDPNYTPSGAGPAESARVGDPFPPTIVLTSPTAGQQLPARSPITIVADAQDRDGTISKVEFFEAGNKIGELTSAPFTFSYNATTERVYDLSAKATDNSGLTAISGTITVTYGDPPQALFVGDNPPNNAGDAAVINRLRSMNFVVTALNDSAADATSAEGKDLILVSSTVQSGDVLDKFTDLAIPLINWEEAIFDELLMTGDSGSAPDHHGSTGSLTQIDIVKRDHPLAAGLNGVQTVTTSPQTISWGYVDITPTDAVLIATVANDPVKWAIWAYEKDATLFDTVTRAQERRVGFFFNASSVLANTPEAWRLFDAAIDWALHRQAAAPAHPADVNADFRLSIGEVVAYAAAWKRGDTWPKDPNPIPISYVVRAGTLWKQGETYRYDAAAGQPPTAWVSAAAGGL